jgi:hypothetical protein
MNCKKCIYCVQVKKCQNKIICKNKILLRKLGRFDDYECIEEPCYCTHYTTKKQYIRRLNDYE